MKTALKIMAKGHKVVFAQSGKGVFVNGKKFANITEAWKMYK